MAKSVGRDTQGFFFFFLNSSPQLLSIGSVRANSKEQNVSNMFVLLTGERKTFVSNWMLKAGAVTKLVDLQEKNKAHEQMG